MVQYTINIRCLADSNNPNPLLIFLSRSCEWTESFKCLRYMCISPRKYILTPHMKGPTSYKLVYNPI